MSDSVATIVYLLMATAFLLLACWKASALRREPAPTLALMVANFVVAAAVYVIASPLGYTAVGSAFGQAWIPTLPIYVGILVNFGLVQLLTIIWTSPSQDPPHRVRHAVIGWSLLYTLAIAVMTVAFLHADLRGPAVPLKFNTEQPDEPPVLFFLGVFLTMLTCGTLHTWHRARRAKPDDERIAHALHWFGRSMAVTFGYVVCSAPAIVAASRGYHQLDAVGVFGSVFGVVGCIGICYAMSGAAVSVWLRERRDIRVLEPLWDLVVAGVDPDLELSKSARPSRLLNVRLNLHRRIIEILDGILKLRLWVTADAAGAVETMHSESLNDEALREKLGLAETGLTAQELEAAVTAAVLRHAVGRLQDARTRSTDASGPTPPSDALAYAMPGQDTAADEERPRLLRVARALELLLVQAALEPLQKVAPEAEPASRADAHSR